MALSYFTATTTAVATAVGMNMWTKVCMAGACGTVATRGQQRSSENSFLGSLQEFEDPRVDVWTSQQQCLLASLPV